ncbi:MAG TPA: phage integrase family protein, partial [Burkholderiaceae bacterium]|nr:phage integrase family protein [Burkholderiaceae bacterium]
MEVLRAIARRARQPGWRLIGIDLSQARQAANSTPTATQTLDDWAAARGLQDWSEAELLEMFQAEQASTRPDSNPQRRNRRINHLRDKQLTTLRALEAMACQKPHSADFISAWFDPLTAHRLQSIGLDLLGELRSTIDRGGRWYIALPAIGPQKAKRIEQLLDTLLPSQTTTLAILHDLTPDARAQLNVDRDVIKAWVEARSTSPATKKVYTREADRWQLWLSIERGKQQLREVNLADCKAYEDFLSNVPIEWQSRKKAQRFGPGWAPFSGLLSAQSQRQALTIVAALHEWLVAADYVPRNPWKLIRRPSPDKSAELMLDTRAFTPGQWQTLQQYVESQPPSPARDRILFTLRFGEATGLSPAELLGARLGDFKKIE